MSGKESLEILKKSAPKLTLIMEQVSMINTVITMLKDKCFDAEIQMLRNARSGLNLWVGEQCSSSFEIIECEIRAQEQLDEECEEDDEEDEECARPGCPCKS